MKDLENNTLRRIKIRQRNNRNSERTKPQERQESERMALGFGKEKNSKMVQKP